LFKRIDTKDLIRIAAIVICVIVCTVLILSITKTIDYGTVTDKRFEPQHTEQKRRYVYIKKQRHVRRYWVTIPDTWKIRVENEEGSEWWIVTEEYYNSVEVGDYVDRRTEEKK